MFHMLNAFWLFCVFTAAVIFQCEQTNSSPLHNGDNGFISNMEIDGLRSGLPFSGHSIDVLKHEIFKGQDQEMIKRRLNLILKARGTNVNLMEGQHEGTDSAWTMKSDPDAKRDVVQLISSLGYPVVIYTVETKDGFLLTLHRIPFGRNQKISDNEDILNDKNGTRPSVFLQHGLVSSSADWVMNFANDSLAFILADHGYDVWMGNSRGNTYSSRHVSLKTSDVKFWDWSFSDMSIYDTPAFIDFILNKTGETSLYYIGHSQGTMTAFSGLTILPEYQDKIRLFVGLAPIIYLNHMISPLKYVTVLTDREIYFLFGRKNFLANDFLIDFFADTLCAKTVTNWVCSNIVFVICGYDTSNMNKTRLTVYMNHTPAGTSVKNMVHFGQLVRSKRFAMYDYGSSSENMEHYGQTTPPAYNASQFHIPSLLFTGSNDWLADPKDVDVLESTLPNIVGKYNIPEWNHLDFVWGMNAANKCYKNILEWLPKY